MRVLYISYDGMTDPLGQSQVLPYLQGIADEGYEVHLLSFEKKAAFEKEEKLIRSICSESGITWHPGKYTKSPPVLSSIYDYRVMRNSAIQLHQKFKFDLVHCRSYLPGMAGMNLKKKYGVKFLFDIRGFWADERVEGKLWNRSNPVFNSVYLYFKKQEKEMFDTADGIISLTNKAVPVIKEISSNARNIPIYVIPCCVDTTLFNPQTISIADKLKLRGDLPLNENSFILTYLGGIGTWYKAAEMFDFFKRLLIRFPNAVFFLITKESASVLHNLATERGIPAEKIIVKPAARKQIPLYLSIADASIYFIMDSFSKQASSPTKQGEVMSMGIPLICNRGTGDSSDIIEAGKSGYICEGYNANEYDKTVNEFRFPVDQQFKDHIRHEAIHHFSLSDGIEKYLEMYQKLLYE